MAKRLYRKKIDRILWLPFYALLIGVAVVIFLVKISGYADCEGVIEPENYHPVVAQYGGRIEKKLVEEGDFVDEGEIVFQFDPENIDYQEKALSSELENLSQSIDLMKERIELMEERNKVVEGELIRLTNLYGKLYQDGGIERKVYEDKMFEYRRYKADYNLQRNQLLLEKTSMIKTKNAKSIELDELNKRKDKLEIKSPCKGRIVSTQTIYRSKESLDYFSWDAQEDSYVEEGSLLGYVIKDSSVVGKVQIPEDKRDKIEVGQDVKITVATHRGTKFLLIKGKLEKISLTAQNGKFLGTVSIDNEEKGIEGMDILGTSITAKIRLKRESLFKQLLGF